MRRLAIIGFIGFVATHAHAARVMAEPHAAAHQPKKRAPKIVPTADLLALNTHEAFTLQPGPQGGFNRVTLRRLARFLRCHHTQRTHPIAERLARLLYQTANHFGWQRLEVIAGYRAPRIAKEKGNPKSPHKRGLACDFRVVGVTNETLRDYVRTFTRVGVGYYPNSGFVHLDVRDKTSAFWVDYSAPGERARYSATPEDDVRKLPTLDDSSLQDAEGSDTQPAERSGERAPKRAADPEASPREDE